MKQHLSLIVPSYVEGGWRGKLKFPGSHAYADKGQPQAAVLFAAAQPLLRRSIVRRLFYFRGLSKPTILLKKMWVAKFPYQLFESTMGFRLITLTAGNRIGQEQDHSKVYLT